MEEEKNRLPLPQGAEGREEAGDPPKDPLGSAEAQADPMTALQKEKAALQAELDRLREAQAVYLEKEAKAQERNALLTLYPEVDPETLPKEVTEQSELPLVAAYALYCRKQALAQAQALAKNAKNAVSAPPSVSQDGTQEGEYTYEEMRQMSKDAVHRNYAGILRSLKNSKNKR